MSIEESNQRKNFLRREGIERKNNENDKTFLNLSSEQSKKWKIPKVIMDIPACITKRFNSNINKLVFFYSSQKLASQ